MHTATTEKKTTPGETMFPELDYLEQLLRFRIQQHLYGGAAASEPQLPETKSFGLNQLSEFIASNKLNIPETLTLLTALAPHVQPTLFNAAMEVFTKSSNDFPKIGAVDAKDPGSFVPTGETINFLLAGGDMEKRLYLQHLFSPDHFFGKNKVLWLEEVSNFEPHLSGRIVISPEFIRQITNSKQLRPQSNREAPASFTQAKLGWDDLAVNESIKDQIRGLEKWLLNHDARRNDRQLKNLVPKGFRVLFQGAAGSGKLAASLLGNHTGRDVYRIELSSVISKYIGETEKNLETIFARAEAKSWILFFDEADALFGKRTDVRDAHDKYANQEVAYLMQRAEDYDGLVILAANSKKNIDEPFIRRFNAVIRFSNAG